MAMISEGFKYNLFEAGTLELVRVAEDLPTHTRIPEVLQMFGNAFCPFGSVRFRLEKGPNIVGHLDQVSNIH